MSVVLIAEDDVDMSELLVGFLSHLGHEVYPVEDERKVIAQAGIYRPELILLDMNLRLTSSNDIARALRADPRFAKTPIVLLSGDLRSIRLSREWRPDGVLPKPFGMRQLKTLLQKLLEPLPLPS